MDCWGANEEALLSSALFKDPLALSAISADNAQGPWMAEYKVIANKIVRAMYLAFFLKTCTFRAIGTLAAKTRTCGCSDNSDFSLSAACKPYKYLLYLLRPPLTTRWGSPGLDRVAKGELDSTLQTYCKVFESICLLLTTIFDYKNCGILSAAASSKFFNFS